METKAKAKAENKERAVDCYGDSCVTFMRLLTHGFALAHSSRSFTLQDLHLEWIES